MSTTDFAARFGFARSDVSLANWRQAPYSTWAFHNVSELVLSVLFPSARLRGFPHELMTSAALLDSMVRAELIPCSRINISRRYLD